MASEEEHHTASEWHDLTPEIREFEENRPRIEYLGSLCLLGRETVLAEADGKPTGVRESPVLLLNLRGHLHPEWGPACVPMEMPMLLDRADVAQLIEALTSSAAEMDAAERGDRD
jgi:hypothetical protein